MKNSAKTLNFSKKQFIFFLFPFFIFLIAATLINEPLNYTEKESLVYTIEEARLSKEVNTFLYSEWNEPVFDFVLTQENTNILRMQKLIKKHGGQDPLAHAAAGMFNLPNMQDDFNKYLKIGRNNKLAAFYVSMTLEENNYLNMQERIKVSENLDLIKIYNKRMENTAVHIRVLYKNLQNMGVSYEAQQMNQSEFMDIIHPDILLEDVSM